MDSHLEKLRKFEIDAVKCWFRPGMHVLEIGGGSGFQASLLASYGCEVLSIDLPNRPVPHECFYPVQDYDGRNIPAADASFDIVFSSNVLEHIQPLPPILSEIRRVLKSGGLVVHILPSSTWRFWTIIAHYVFMLKSLLGLQRANPGMANAANPTAAIRRHGLAFVIKRILIFPFTPHGEYPNAFAELYYFSRGRWLRVFKRNGFKMVKITRNHLFYTGYGIFPNLPLQHRQKIACILGSACHIFVMCLIDKY